jgi:hypothetical protein
MQHQIKVLFLKLIALHFFIQDVPTKSTTRKHSISAAVQVNNTHCPRKKEKQCQMMLPVKKRLQNPSVLFVIETIALILSAYRLLWENRKVTPQSKCPGLLLSLCGDDGLLWVRMDP